RKSRASINSMSPKLLATCCASITRSPSRGPGGSTIWAVSGAFSRLWATRVSYAERRALLLACRARGLCLTHSSSSSRVCRRAARQGGDVRITRRAAQSIHRDLDGAVEFPCIGLVDLLLEFALLGDQRIHLCFREVFGKAGADCLEAIEQSLGLGEPRDDIAE